MFYNDMCVAFISPRLSQRIGGNRKTLLAIDDRNEKSLKTVFSIVIFH